jgi:DNA repair protein RecO (recombination protein O)
MAAEKALALVLRTTDWSETSRIATLWTREFGKVRALAKGGRRLKSAFESALDLLTLCSIVVLRKSSGTLDLLTEAQVVERFPRLRADLSALYAAYYVAELLSEWTQDYDPHPELFDEAVATLRTLGQPGVANGPRLGRFELVLLRELGYHPVLAACAACGNEVRSSSAEGAVLFSPAAGGVLCLNCRTTHKDGQPLSLAALQALQEWAGSGDAWQKPWEPVIRQELRQLLNRYVVYLLGRRPRLLPYLGS